MTATPRTFVSILLAAACTLAPTAPVAAATWYRVYAGISSPVEITHAGDGSNRLFLVQQSGRVLIAKGAAVLPTPFLDISALILGGGERGLLGIAFHPQYASNRQFFVNYTRAGDGATVIARYTASLANPDLADPASATILLTIAQPYANHNGGSLKFGPDGFLYIGTGDGGSGNDPEARAQDKTTLLGKILRIDVNSGNPYAIPPGNPFPTGVGGRAEIFAIGMRNPWRISFDRQTGDLWIGDVGQNAFEEIDLLPAGTGSGANLGWRVLEGNQCTGLSGPVTCTDPTLTAPVITYSHSVGCSVTGGYVYRGPSVSDLLGKYVYGDFCSGRLWAAAKNGMAQWIPVELAATNFGISTFGEDEAGELYFANFSTGDIFRFVETPPPSPQFTLNTAGLGFGDVNVGSASGTKTAYVTNTGGGTLSLTALTPGGANAGEFTRGGTCAVGSALSAGQGCTVTYRFTPATAGARSATLALASNAGSAALALSGNGVGAANPVLGVGATALSFGNVNLGASSATQAFNVTNTGGGTLTLASLTPGGTNPGDFARTGTCANGTTLAAAQSCTVIYQFTPAAAGARAANLAIASNGGNATITLGGTGVAVAPPPALTLSASSLAFGSINVGASSATQTITATNTGGGTLTLATLTPSGANPGDFIRTGTCANGTALMAAQSCTVIYQFTPAAAGARAASLAIASNGGNPTITLGGTGVAVVPVLAVGATAVTFGNVSVGASSAPQAFDVTNTGGGTLTLTSLTAGGTDPGEFTRTGTCTNGTALTAAQSCTVIYQFTPAAAGARAASLVIATSAGSASVMLTGTGTIAAAILTVTPGALDFGSQNIGTTSAPQTVSVANTGTANLTLGTVGLGGPNPGDFLLSGNCAANMVLVPNASCSLTLRFHALVVGGRSASLAIAHTAAGSPAAVSLAGTGATVVATVDVIEFYHAGLDHYFISSLAADIAALDSGRFQGWSRTGYWFKAFGAMAAGASPVCRFYLPPIVGNSHFFSGSQQECVEVLAKFPIFTYESPAVMYTWMPDVLTGACPAQTTPVYRLWNRRADSNHRYTTDRALRDYHVARGDIPEGYGPDGVVMCAAQ